MKVDEVEMKLSGRSMNVMQSLRRWTRLAKTAGSWLRYLATASLPLHWFLPLFFTGYFNPARCTRTEDCTFLAGTSLEDASALLVL